MIGLGGQQQSQSGSGGGSNSGGSGSGGGSSSGGSGGGGGSQNQPQQGKALSVHLRSLGHNKFIWFRFKRLKL